MRVREPPTPQLGPAAWLTEVDREAPHPRNGLSTSIVINLLIIETHLFASTYRPFLHLCTNLPTARLPTRPASSGVPGEAPARCRLLRPGSVTPSSILSQKLDEQVVRPLLLSTPLLSPPLARGRRSFAAPRR